MKDCAMFPAEMHIDYIRVYQNRQDTLHTLGCSPDAFPTREYIEAHADRYANWAPITDPNLASNEAILVDEKQQYSAVEVLFASAACIIIIFGSLKLMRGPFGSSSIRSSNIFSRHEYIELPSKVSELSMENVDEKVAQHSKPVFSR